MWLFLDVTLSMTTSSRLRITLGFIIIKIGCVLFIEWSFLFIVALATSRNFPLSAIMFKPWIRCMNTCSKTMHRFFKWGHLSVIASNGDLSTRLFTHILWYIQKRIRMREEKKDKIMYYVTRQIRQIINHAHLLYYDFVCLLAYLKEVFLLYWQLLNRRMWS